MKIGNIILQLIVLCNVHFSLPYPINFVISALFQKLIFPKIRILRKIRYSVCKNYGIKYELPMKFFSNMLLKDFLSHWPNNSLTYASNISDYSGLGPQFYQKRTSLHVCFC